MVVMEPLLTVLSTSYTSIKGSEKSVTEIPESSRPISEPPSSATTPTGALETLRTEPNYDSLIATLRYLGRKTSGFDLHSPSPLTAQIIHVLVSSTLPNYWEFIKESGSSGQLTRTKKRRPNANPDRDLLLSCLRSVSGLKAVLLELQQQAERSKLASRNVKAEPDENILTILLQVLSALLDGDEVVQSISAYVSYSCNTAPKEKLLWNTFLKLVAGGKIIGTAAEAESISNALSRGVGRRYWIADGLLYSSWLARNITVWAKSLSADSQDCWGKCCELLSKSLRLGYTEAIIRELVASLLLQQRDYSAHFLRLLEGLSIAEHRNILYCLLKILAVEHFPAAPSSGYSSEWWVTDAAIISAAAGLLNLITAGTETSIADLVNWLTSPSGAGVGDSIAIRRAVLAALTGSDENMATVLEKSLQQCGDSLYIRHTPTLQQEVHVQVLLLAAGHAYRKTPARFTKIMRSGAHLSVVSNRLAAPSSRARFLGMIVGEALSGLIDRGDKIMDFKTDETKTDEAKWYKSLLYVSDSVGSITPLKTGVVKKAPTRRSSSTAKQNTTLTGPPRGTRILDLEGTDNDESDLDLDDDGLTPYAKPDSDAEDSDDDPTMTTHNKVTAPVYIRDLIIYLRDIDNYDRQKMALSTAAPLIRRKAHFGTEVSSHAEEMASLLVGLQDKYEIENFQDMRIQGMIAVLVALPFNMGQWFSKTFFDGDYSISQRVAILTTLGVGARELGGFGAEDANLVSMKSVPSTSFPSKLLPKHIETRLGLSAPQPTQVDALATQLYNTMITPMAADLADKMTGPSVLKVRTFSSRMEVERKRHKPIANALAKIVADGLFFPLTGRFFIHLRAYGSSRSNVAFQPYLLALFIKTLSLLIHASGPSNLSLPQMTSEFWELLLSLRAQSIGDVTVIEALLFAFLTILEINDDKKRLVEAHGRQMLETQEWIGGVIARVGVGAGEEDEKLRLLAASCLVRIREVVEKYQALLMGDLSSF